MIDHLNIRDFLASEAWHGRFEADVLGAGMRLAPRVCGLSLKKHEAGALAFSAEINGARCVIELWQAAGSWEFESECCCESRNNCAHAVGILERARKERDLEKLAARSTTISVVDSLPAARELLRPPPSELPRLCCKPSFELHISCEPAHRSVRLLLQSLGQKETGAWISACATVNYEGHRSSLRSTAPDWASEISLRGERTILEHDSAAENAAAQQLRDTGLSSLHSNSSWRFMLNLKEKSADAERTVDLWFPDPGRIPIDTFWHQFRGEMVERLTSLGWKISFEEKVGHQVHEADPEQWQSELMPVEGGWFSLSVGFDVGGKRYDLLPILAGLLESDFLEETLDRPHNGHVYTPLPGGDALRLPIGRVRKILHHLAALIDPKFPDRARLHELDVASLNGLAGLGVEPPASIAALASKLRSFSGIEMTPLASGLQATLREYQLEGFRWMQFLVRHGLHGILADDMGLGKTLQTLAHVLAEKESGRSGNTACLVVAPTSVVPNWRAEAAKFTPSLRVLVLQGAERKKYFRSIPHADLVLTSFALLQRDVEKLAANRFHIIILDEAQNIKNPRAKVAQAACRLVSNQRLCLSGTPIENHLGELWSLMHFLIPGFLGTEDAFNKRFRTPIEKNGDAARNEALKQRIAPLILRRTKDQVATELPPKTELVHLIELHTGQKDLYETVRATMDKRVRDAIAARGIQQSQIVFLDALLKLRQICCDPRLLPADFSNSLRESAKLDFLSELLRMLVEEGRRILLFSQFTSMLALIEAHLLREKIGYIKLTGESKNRGELVEIFQSGKVPLFLISLKAGGTGLNLTAADTVIHYDPWWNPAAEAQATDRAYRIGQDKPVFVHKLLCQDTVEERIHKLQQEKSKLAASLLSDADISRRLDAKMMRALLDP